MPRSERAGRCSRGGRRSCAGCRSRGGRRSRGGCRPRGGCRSRWLPVARWLPLARWSPLSCYRGRSGAAASFVPHDRGWSAGGGDDERGDHQGRLPGRAVPWARAPLRARDPGSGADRRARHPLHPASHRRSARWRGDRVRGRTTRARPTVAATGRRTGHGSLLDARRGGADAAAVGGRWDPSRSVGRGRAATSRCPLPRWCGGRDRRDGGTAAG